MLKFVASVAWLLCLALRAGFVYCVQPEAPRVLTQPVIESDVQTNNTPVVVTLKSLEESERVDDFVLVVRVHGEETVGYLSVSFESDEVRHCYFTWSNKVVFHAREEVEQYGLYQFLIPERELIGVKEIELDFRPLPAPASREDAKAQVVELRKHLGETAIFQVSMTRWPGMLEGEWLPLPVPPDEGDRVEYLFGVEGSNQDFVFNRKTSKISDGLDGERQDLPSISGRGEETVYWRIDPVTMNGLVCWVTAEEFDEDQENSNLESE